MTECEAWELNTKIAEALGFRFEEFADKLRIITPRPSEQWKREAYGAVLVPRNSKYPYETTFDIGLRDWARDTDAALELAFDSGFDVCLNPDGGGDVPTWYQAHLKRNSKTVRHENADTIAEAICYAWLWCKKNETRSE